MRWSQIPGIRETIYSSSKKAKIDRSRVGRAEEMARRLALEGILGPSGAGAMCRFEDCRNLRNARLVFIVCDRE